jgi:hypothetical protein
MRHAEAWRGVVAHGRHSGRVAPAVVGIEQRAYGDAVVDCLVAPARRDQAGKIRGSDGRGIVIDDPDKAQQRSLGF